MRKPAVAISASRCSGKYATVWRRAYAGDDIEKPRHLAKDPQYLLELPRSVQHFDILVNEWEAQ